MSKEIVVTLRDVAIYHADNPSVTLTPRTKERAGEKILENFDFEVAAGEVVYLIGKVGSGKSSLLKTLYGELALVEGSGAVVGYDLSTIKQRHIPYLRRKVSMIFQDLLVLSDRNVYDNLACALEATGWSGKAVIESRINEVLEMVNLKGKEYRMPFELSGGERQRLVIARALLNNPAVILADEPTGNLDPVTAEGIVRLFHEIASQGTAIIMSTHNTSLIESFPSRTLLFAQGRVREIDITTLCTKSTI